MLYGVETYKLDSSKSLRRFKVFHTETICVFVVSVLSSSNAPSTSPPSCVTSKTCIIYNQQNNRYCVIVLVKIFYLWQTWCLSKVTDDTSLQWRNEISPQDETLGPVWESLEAGPLSFVSIKDHQVLRIWYIFRGR